MVNCMDNLVVLGMGYQYYGSILIPHRVIVSVVESLLYYLFVSYAMQGQCALGGYRLYHLNLNTA